VEGRPAAGGLRRPGPEGSTVSVTVLGPRDAETAQAGSAAGSPARTARILGAPQRGSGFGSPAETGSESESLALPGTHSSWHMSQSAATLSSTTVPGLRSAGGVIVTGRSRSPS
jgi:hypothetical protein